MQKISAHSLPISPVGPMNTCPVAYGCKCGRTSSSKDRSLSPLSLTPARTCADSTCSNRTMNPASFVSELAGRVPSPAPGSCLESPHAVRADATTSAPITAPRRFMAAPSRPHIGSPSHRVPLLGRRYKEDSAIRRCGRTPAQVRTTPHRSRIELRAHLQWPCFVRAGQACRGQDAGERSERRSIDAGHGRPDRCRPRRAADECGGGALRGDRPTHRPPSREGREPGTEPRSCTINDLRCVPFRSPQTRCGAGRRHRDRSR